MHLTLFMTGIVVPPYVLYAMPHGRLYILTIVKVQAQRRLVALRVVKPPQAPSLVVSYPH
jgi:hypothetical protein